MNTTYTVGDIKAWEQALILLPPVSPQGGPGSKHPPSSPGAAAGRGIGLFVDGRVDFLHKRAWAWATHLAADARQPSRPTPGAAPVSVLSLQSFTGPAAPPGPWK